MKDSLLKKQVVPFTQVSNNLINDKNLSLKSKGLYVFMFSKPQGWNFTIRSMSKQMKDGVDSISSSLRELKDYGWVNYKKKQDGSGVYTLNHLEASVFSPNTENPDTENPNLGKPMRISNTDLYSNTNNNLLSSKKKRGYNIVRQDYLERYLKMFNGLKEKFVGQKSSKTIHNKKLIKEWNEFVEQQEKEEDIEFTHIPNIRKSMEGACKSEWHKDNNYKHITPEFFLRADKREYWLDIYNSEHSEKVSRKYDVKELLFHKVVDK